MITVSVRTVDVDSEESKAIHNRIHRYHSNFAEQLSTRADARQVYQGVYCPVAIEKTLSDGSTVAIEFMAECTQDHGTSLLCATVSETVRRAYFQQVASLILLNFQKSFT